MEETVILPEELIETLKRDEKSIHVIAHLVSKLYTGLKGEEIPEELTQRLVLLWFEANLAKGMVTDG